MGMATAVLAKRLGMRVLSTTRQEGKVSALRDAGVDEVILDDGQVADRVQTIVPGGVDAALELGIDDPALLYGVLKGNDRLRRLGLGPLISKATIKRETWESLEKFISPYQEVASAMELGTPKRVK